MSSSRGGRALVRRAVSETRRLDGSLDTLQIAEHLFDTGVILGDEMAWGESRVIAALDACDSSPYESDVVDAICRELGFKAVTS